MMRQHSKSTPKQIKQLHRMVNKTLKDFSLFPHEARILVACSGGPDSMVLLNVLQYVKDGGLLALLLWIILFAEKA